MSSNKEQLDLVAVAIADSTHIHTQLLAEALRNSRSAMNLELQFLVNRYNEAQVPEAYKFAAKIGAVLKLKSMQVIDPAASDAWMPENERFRRYRRKDSAFQIKSKLANRCSRLWFSPVITWDGYVVPCCFDKDAQHLMGDLKDSSFRTIWRDQRYVNFRRKILESRRNIDICTNCTEGTKVWED